jgi:hypothetical protein
MRKIEIGGHNYNIKYMDGEKEGTEGRFLLGLNNPRSCEIFLDNSMKRSRMVETFLHEVIHVILSNTGCKHDENTIDCLANGFHQLGLGEFLWRKTLSK